jgi:hypothetical protein
MFRRMFQFETAIATFLRNLSLRPVAFATLDIENTNARDYSAGVFIFAAGSVLRRGRLGTPMARHPKRKLRGKSFGKKSLAVTSLDRRTCPDGSVLSHVFSVTCQIGIPETGGGGGGWSRYPPASCRARSVARITALIRVTRRPPSSISSSPSAVQPAGVVTASLSSAGCSPVSSTMRAAP